MIARACVCVCSDASITNIIHIIMRLIYLVFWSASSEYSYSPLLDKAIHDLDIVCVDLVLPDFFRRGWKLAVI